MTDDECWEFLRSREFGRLAFHLVEQVHITPINYAVDHETLLFRTAPGSKLLGIVMMPSPPAMAIDMAHAGLESIISQMDADVNEVILFKTELLSEEHRIKSDILFMPDTRTLNDILRLLEELVGPIQ